MSITFTQLRSLLRLFANMRWSRLPASRLMAGAALLALSLAGVHADGLS